MVDLLAFLLGSEEMEISTFTDPRKFISQFTPGSFDLILVDLAMPNLHGLDLFRLIRKEDGSVPVIALTSQPAATEYEKAIREGFADFYVKPIGDVDAFRRDIHHYLSNRDG
jgi:two-component system phosphoglycerate transport system response regulator PgtA